MLLLLSLKICMEIYSIHLCPFTHLRCTCVTVMWNPSGTQPVVCRQTSDRPDLGCGLPHAGCIITIKWLYTYFCFAFTAEDLLLDSRDIQLSGSISDRCRAGCPAVKMSLFHLILTHWPNRATQVPWTPHIMHSQHTYPSRKRLGACSSNSTRSITN